MPYRVIAEEGTSVSILKKVGEWKSSDGHILQEDHESVPRVDGEILADDEVAPSIVALYEGGDQHVRSYLVRVNDKGETNDTPAEPVEKAAKPPAEEPRIVSGGDTSGTVKTAPAATKK